MDSATVQTIDGLDAQRAMAMTVVLGALCDGGQSAIILADRKLTFGNMAEREGPSKIFQIGPAAAVAGAGDAAFLGRVVALIQGSDMAKVEASATVSLAYSEIRRGLIEDATLLPIGYHYDRLMESGLQELGERVFGQLIDKFNSWPMKDAFVLISRDVSGQCHVGRVVNPGAYASHDAAGFATEGEGVNFALPLMFMLGATPNDSTASMLVKLFIVKAFTQVAPSVGPGTDAWMLGPSGLAPVSAAAMQVVAETCAPFLTRGLPDPAAVAAALRTNEKTSGPA